MTESQIVQITFFASLFVLFGVFSWMPVTRGPRAFFGVRVEPDYFAGAGRRVLLRYRLMLAAAFVIIAAIAAGVRPLVADPIVPVAAELALAIAAFSLYIRFAAGVRPHASVDGAKRFASSMRAREERSRVWLDVVVATLTALTFAVPLFSSGEIPPRISVVLFAPALAAYLQFFLYVLRRDFAAAKMTLPADATEDYLRAKEQYLRANVDTVDWARGTIALAFCGLSLMRTSESIALAGVLVGGGALIAGIGFFLVRMIRINAQLRRQTGNDYAQRAADERHWLHGGLTYANPDDPALVVEKLAGVGYTLNMAHPGVRNRLLLMTGVPVFVIWAVLAM